MQLRRQASSTIGLAVFPWIEPQKPDPGRLQAFVLALHFGYLRRNPNDAPDSDYTGYDFWLTKLNEFNGNFVQAEMVISSIEYRERFGQWRKRLGTSAEARTQ